MIRTTSRMGWRPDLPDYRDEPFKFARALSGEMVSSGDMPPGAQPQRKELDRHPVRDQGNAGSCVGHGVGLIAAIERNVSQRSPLFIYAEARKMIGELDRDEGAYIRDGVKVVSTLGAPVERRWPYNLDRLFDDPPDVADRDALKRRVFSYHRVEGGQEFRSCLAGGHLFTIGFTVYSSIGDAKVENFGILPLPQGWVEGGHCIAVIGYDDNFAQSAWAQWARNNGYPESEIPPKVYECQNSWGRGWGVNGRFVVDAAYFENPDLADDAWTLRGFADERK